MIKNVLNCTKLYKVVLFCTLMYGVDSDIVIVEKFDHQHLMFGGLFVCIWKPRVFLFPSYLSPFGAGSIPAAHIKCRAACTVSADLQCLIGFHCCYPSTPPFDGRNRRSFMMLTGLPFLLLWNGIAASNGLKVRFLHTALAFCCDSNAGET